MKSFYEYDISFGLVTPTGGLLKQLMVSIQIPQISKAFFFKLLTKNRDYATWAVSANWH